MCTGKRNMEKWMQKSSKEVLDNVGVELEKGEQWPKNRADAVPQKMSGERHGCGVGRWTRRL